MTTILTYAEAAALVLDQGRRLAAAAPRKTEQLPLLDALHRVLATPVSADRDLPPFDRSTRDGYAVRAAALMAGDWLPVTGILRAGEAPRSAPLESGAALEIMTGAPVPEGADAIVMLEHVEIAGDRIRLSDGRQLRPGSHIVPAGSEARSGDPIVPAGTRLAAAHIAALAAVGVTHVEVFARPRVAILATGDELVEISARRNRTRSATPTATVSPRRSHSPAESRGALASPATTSTICELLLIARSNPLTCCCSPAASPPANTIWSSRHSPSAALSSISPASASSPASLPSSASCPRARRERSLPFFGLPGNPVSTMVTFLLFAAPVLRALAGESSPAPRFAQARITTAESAADITRFLPAHLDAGWDHATVRRIPWQGSGDLAATAQSNCFVVLPPDTAVEASRVVQLLLP